jgi:hypothetical protein
MNRSFGPLYKQLTIKRFRSPTLFIIDESATVQETRRRTLMESQAWELQQLHQSRLFFGLNTHFPLLLSSLSRVPKMMKGHHHELLHYYSLIHYFISRTHEMK